MARKIDIVFEADPSQTVAAINLIMETMKKLPQSIQQATVVVNKDLTVGIQSFKEGVDDAGIATKEFSLAMINLRDAGSAFVIIAADIQRVIDGAVSSFAAFDKIVQQTITLATKLGEDIDVALREDISDAAREMAVRFNQDINKTVEALRELVAMGFTVEESMEILEAGSQAAVAGLGTVDMTTSLLANTLRAFGIDVADVTKVAAIFTFVANETSLTMDDFAVAMQFAGATAGQMGFELEEVAAILGLMRSAGLDASIAGTTLRQFLVRIQDPASEARQLLGDLGIELTDANGNFLSLIEIMRNVDLATRNLTESQRAQVIATLFETRGQAAFNVTMAQGLETLENLTSGAGAMNDARRASNFLTETSNKMLDTEAVAYERARKQQEITAQILGEKLIPMQTNLILAQDSLVRGLIEMPGHIGTTNAFLLQLGSTVLGTSGQFFLFVTSMQTAAKSIAKTLPAMKAFFSTMFGGGEMTAELTRKMSLMRSALIGLGLAYAGLIMFTNALNAQNEQERVMYSALTGLTWGLAAAQMALAITKQLSIPVIGIGLAIAAGAAFVTWLVASQAAIDRAKSAQQGAFLMARPGRGTLVRAGEGTDNEFFAPEPMLRRVVREEMSSAMGREMGETGAMGSDTFIFNIPPTQRITERDAREIAEITTDIKRRKLRQVGF